MPAAPAPGIGVYNARMNKISRYEAKKAGLLRYFTGEPCKRGHIAERRVSNFACLICHRENQSDLLKKDKDFKARQQNASKRWKSTQVGMESCRRSNKIKKAKNKDKERARLRNLRARKMATSMSERIRCTISNRISSLIRKGGRSTSDILKKQCGYTVQELMEHLQRQFTPGMNWSNYGRSGWHIDHIVPVSDFDLTDDAQFAACWGLGNLRPLWGIENSKKGRAAHFLL